MTEIRYSLMLAVLGAVAAALGVMAGAFGAHGLAARVTPERLATFETAARYHLIHAVAVLVVGWWAAQAPSLALPGWLLLAGMVVFSGSLYLLVLTDTPWLGAVTPFGGLLMIVGWLLLGWRLWRLGAGGG